MVENSLYSGIWMYAWDLQDEGLDKVLGFIADSGLTAIHLAGSYHAGFFLHPHNPRHKAYFTEDGVVYFQPQIELFEKTKLKPKVAKVSKNVDWFTEVGSNLESYGLKLVPWIVCNHNTRLGKNHPDCAVRNVFGDVYFHALCPSNENTRQYVRALCKNLSSNYPLHAIQLEAISFMGMVHGHHHERYGTVLSPLEISLMSLCFCKSCSTGARKQGIYVDKVKKAVRKHLVAFFKHAPNRPFGLPSTMSQFLEKNPELEKFRAYREEVVDSLIKNIKKDLNSTSNTKLFLLSGYRESLMGVADAYTYSAYGKGPDEILRTVEEQRQKMPAGEVLHVGISLGFGRIKNGEELQQIIRTIKIGGGDGVLFYNYSEAPITELRWIKSALTNQS